MQLICSQATAIRPGKSRTAREGQSRSLTEIAPFDANIQKLVY
jgi:hypothetical protein